MFEAIHGSAPRRAGQNLANPSGLLEGAVMLNHIGNSNSRKVQNAWLKLSKTEFIPTIYNEGISKEKVGTKNLLRLLFQI
jgi:isocitrate dehydrogenase